MKSLKLLFTAVLIALGGLVSTASAQCAASFSDTNFVGNSVFLFNTSGSWATTYNTWTFPGTAIPSVSGYVDSLTVTFPGPGTYTVCFTLYDAGLGCTDTICQTVIVNGSDPLIVSGSSSPTGCGACNGGVTANVYGGVAPYSYLWNTGATSTSISGLCAGTYDVTVIDAAGDTAIHSYTILTSGGVSVNATDSATCFGVYVEAGAWGGTAPYSYSWDNGATTFSTIYSAPAYEANVFVTDANGCTGMDSVVLNFAPPFMSTVNTTNETCQTCCDGSASVSVSGGTAQPFSYQWSNGDTGASVSGLCPAVYTVTIANTLSGCDQVKTVTIGSYVCPTLSGEITQGFGSIVYLIQESGGVLSLVDSIFTDSLGFYYFQNVCSGTYYVKAALLPSHPLYSSYVPTYYTSSSLWSSATAVVVSGNTNGIDINLLAGTNQGGPGFIGGLISQGANRSEGDPVIGAQVNLLGENDEFVAYTYSDANGKYAFDNLAYGSYKVYVDILNFEAYPFSVTIDSDFEVAQGRNFVVEGGVIKPKDVTGIATIESLGIKVYPNPAKGVVNLQGDVNGVEIYSVLGEKVFSQSNITSTNVAIDIENLSAGQYIMSLTQGDAISHFSLIVE